MIPDVCKRNFDQLADAFADDEVCVLEVREKATGETRYAITVVWEEEGQVKMIPSAILIESDPFELYDPPDEAKIYPVEGVAQMVEGGTIEDKGDQIDLSFRLKVKAGKRILQLLTKDIETLESEGSFNGAEFLRGVTLVISNAIRAQRENGDDDEETTEDYDRLFCETHCTVDFHDPDCPLLGTDERPEKP